MSAANYWHCPGCDRKALYMGDGEAPEGIEVWHASCRAEHAAAAVAAEKERIALALHEADSWHDIHALEASAAGQPCTFPGHQPPDLAEQVADLHRQFVMRLRAAAPESAYARKLLASVDPS